MNFARDHDSFVRYQKPWTDIAFIEKQGIEASDRERRRRAPLWSRMIAGFNDGRSKSFFCGTATVLESGELGQALAQAERSATGVPGKEKAKAMRRALEEIAREKNYSLKLRKEG